MKKRCIVCGKAAENFKVCAACSKTNDSTTGDRLHPAPKKRLVRV